MKPLSKISLKILLFSFIVINLQIAIVGNCYGFTVNLPFASIIVFAALLSLYEAVFAALIFMVLTSIFSYDSQILWIYPILAFIAVKLNPSHIDDKFLVAVIYSLVFTPLLELFSLSNQEYLARTLNSSLSTIASVILLFFIVKFFFKTQKTSSYPSLK